MGKRVDKSTGYYVLPEQWNTEKQKVKGNSTAGAEINSWINTTIGKISELYREGALNKNIHLQSMINGIFAKPTAEPTLLQVIQEHILELKQRVGKDYTFSTYEKYLFTRDKVHAFIIEVLKVKDILLKDVTTKFIMDFDHYLRVHDSNMHNTAVKYCLNLKRVMNIAVMQGLIPINPFNRYKTVYKDTEQVYLNEAEVIKLSKARLTKPVYQLVRDMFIFQCYTGLAYTDMLSLSLKNINKDHNGKQWILKARQKTGISSTIPLLPDAIKLIEKYSIVKKPIELVFPGISIQKFNQYIKEIADLVGIQEKLSSHVGRRTFGNIALAKGISINVISKILGHSNTIITQRIYAITTQNIISHEMEKWK